MNERKVVNPWQVTVVYKCIREHLLVRNLINVINMAKPFHAELFSCIIEEHIQETNPMNVDNVVKPFHITIVSKYIEEGPCECDQCGNTFVWNSHRLRHKRIQTGKKHSCLPPSASEDLLPPLSGISSILPCVLLVI